MPNLLGDFTPTLQEGECREVSDPILNATLLVPAPHIVKLKFDMLTNF